MLIEPSGFDVFVAAIEHAGWRERASTLAGSVFTTHSRTFVHRDWPCDLDVHRFFPGFLAEPETVFDELWRRHEAIEVAQLFELLHFKIVGICPANVSAPASSIPSGAA